MSYIKINGDETHYHATITPFTTQHGFRAIRFKGDDIPETDMGFVVYEDNGVILSNLSDYKYVYRPNEYSVGKDIIEYPVGSNEELTPLPNPFVSVAQMITQVNEHTNEVDAHAQEMVEEITPYTETKTAYIDDTDIVFETDAMGVITILAIDRDGITIPTTFEREGNKIIVSFEPLQQVTNVTISIQ